MAREPIPTLELREFLPAVTGTLPTRSNRLLWAVHCGVGEEIRVTYAGTHGDLIAAGCAPPEMLAPWAPGKTQRDDEGDRVLREFRKGWLRLTRVKPVVRALRLPGITIEAVRQAKALQAARFPWLAKYPDLSAYEEVRIPSRVVDAVAEILSRFAKPQR